MKFYGRAQEVAQKILAAFQSGDIPRPLARCFLNRRVPMSVWSWNNQFGCYICGCTDARGFRQWHEAGRKVKRGQQAQAAILVPLQARKEDEEDSRPVMVTYGFRGIPVFDVSQTEGADLDYEAEERRVLDGLPLLVSAQRLGLTVKVAQTTAVGALGSYSRSRQLIRLGVSDIDVWLHELVHAADDRLGNLTERGQHWRSELVAELGATTLAVMMGEEEKANLGGAWDYIQRYSTEARVEPVTACMRVLDRTAEAINLIMELSNES